jgi:hypothetical protein
MTSGPACVGSFTGSSCQRPRVAGSSIFGGRSLPPIRGLSPEASRRANFLLGRGSGMRVQPGRDEEFDQLHTDYFAVWDRSRAYAAAVLALLRART